MSSDTSSVVAVPEGLSAQRRRFDEDSSGGAQGARPRGAPPRRPVTAAPPDAAPATTRRAWPGCPRDHGRPHPSGNGAGGHPADQRDLLQRPRRGTDLGQHVDAVPVALHHPGDPTHLTLDLAQPGQVIILVRAVTRRHRRRRCTVGHRLLCHCRGHRHPPHLVPVAPSSATALHSSIIRTYPTRVGTVDPAGRGIGPYPPQVGESKVIAVRTAGTGRRPDNTRRRCVMTAPGAVTSTAQHPSAQSSVHQMRWVSGSAEAYGRTPDRRVIAHCSPVFARSTVAMTCPAPSWRSPASFQRPMWWLQATTPGRMPSVTQVLTTKYPIAVSTRTRSPAPTPSRPASYGWIHSGLVWASSLSHLALPPRVWIWTGSRKVEMSTIWSESSADGCMWLRT